MGVIIATKEEVQEYYLSEALGQSKLKGLLGDVAFFNKEFDSSAEHFLIGSAVDCILTGEEGEFQNKYYVSQVEKLPSEAMVEILRLVYNDLLADYAEHLEVVTTLEGVPHTSFPEFVGELNTWEAYIKDAYTQTGWQPKWGDEAKLRNILEQGTAYFMDLCKAFGKQVISATQSTLIENIVQSLRTNARTSHYFNRVSFTHLDQITMYYQFPIYFEYRGVKCKALLDMVIVERDSEGRIISVTGIDLKTMNGNTFNFGHSIKARRYDIQAAWYTLALRDYFAIPDGSEVLKPFLFIVESTTQVGKPLVFEVDQTLLEIGKNGRRAVSLIDTNLFQDEAINTVILHEVKGYEQLLDMYLYHTENGFNEERDIQEAGVEPLRISWDGIIRKEIS